MTTTLNFQASRALVIGIDEYVGGIPRLRTAVNDARSIAQVLEADHGYASPRLLTEAVTLERLRRLFAEELPAEVGPDDRVLVYFAGHGIALDGDDGPAGFLVPQDARRDDRASFLPMIDLSAWLDALPCRHLLLVLDCCFAGAFRWSSTRDMGTPPEVMYRERFDRFVRDPAWQVLTSAAHDQQALDVLSGETIGLRSRDAEEAEHSPFAAAFLRALAGEADVARGKLAVGDGVVTASELYLFLRDAVEVGAEGINHRQTPGFWPLKKHEKGEFVHLVSGHKLDLPPAPELTDEANPWRGLQSYDEAQASLFFGRSQFVARLADRVKSQPLTVVLGASGTGKSSVVQAGLLAWLRPNEPDAWSIVSPFRPGKSPLAALAAMAVPGEASDADNIALRQAVSRTDPEALARRVGEWVALNASNQERLLIVVDQFEELITLCIDAEERAQFIHQLDLALTAHSNRLRVVLTLRSDFEPQFAHTPLEDEWLASRIVVPAWTLDEYREAIEGPASARVLYFRGNASSQTFVNRLIGDVANTPGALPLLSFTLSELYRRYLTSGTGDRSLAEADYEALGGVGGSLRNRADEIYNNLPDDAHRATLQRVMLRMVSVEGGELARRRVLKDEIVYMSEDENARVREVQRRMDDARLVVSGKDEDDRPVFEPAHDELIRGWSRLLEWTRQNLGSLQLGQVLAPAVRDWCRDPIPDPGKLWHTNPRLGLLAAELGLPHQWHRYLGKRIRDRVHQVGSGVPLRPTWLNRDEARFVAQSLAKRHRTTSIIATTTFSTVVVLALLTVFALIQRGNAITNETKAKEKTQLAEDRLKTATSRQLAALSVSERDKQLDRSLLLAVEALNAENTFEARDTLYQALRDRPGLKCFFHTGEVEIQVVAFSPDGKTLAAGVDSDLVLWDLTTRKRLTGDSPLLSEGRVQSLAFSPDGKTLAVGFANVGHGGGVVLWDMVTHKRLSDDPLPVEEGGISAVAFSPDGITLAAASVDDRIGSAVVIWDVAARRRLTAEPLAVFEGTIKSVIFSGDGKALAAAYSGRSLEGDGGVVLWDVASRKRQSDQPLAVKEGSISSVAFSPDGEAVAAAYTNYKVGGGVVLWSTATRNRLSNEPLPVTEGNVLALVFSVDGRTLTAPYAEITNDNRSGGGMVQWDLTTRKRLMGDTLFLKEGRVEGMAISPDAKSIAVKYRTVGGRGCNIVLWGIAARDRLMAEPLPVTEGNVWGVAVSHDGKMLAAGFAPAVSGTGGGLVLWSLAERRRLTAEPLPVTEGDVFAVAFSPDGKTIAASYANSGSGSDSGVVMWDLATRNRLMAEPLPVKQGRVESLAFSPDGKTLAAAFSSGDEDVGGGVVMWDLADRKRPMAEPFAVEEGGVKGIAFSPDGKTLAAGYHSGRAAVSSGVVLWSVATRKRLTSSPLHVNEGDVVGMAFSPDGKMLAAAYVGGDENNGEGNALGEGGVVLWDGVTHKRMMDEPLRVNEGDVNGVAFSRNSKTLAVGYTSVSDSVVLWDLADRNRLMAEPLPTRFGGVRALASIPDGMTLAVAYIAGIGEVGGNVAIWDVDPKSWQTLAGKIANRNFTMDEWRQYFPDEPGYRRTFPDLPDGKGVAEDRIAREKARTGPSAAKSNDPR